MQADWRSAGIDPATRIATAFCGGCVLAEGEPFDSPRARAQAGPHATIGLHNLVELEQFGNLGRAIPPASGPGQIRCLLDALAELPEAPGQALAGLLACRACRDFRDGLQVVVTTDVALSGQGRSLSPAAGRRSRPRGNAAMRSRHEPHPVRRPRPGRRLARAAAAAGRRPAAPRGRVPPGVPLPHGRRQPTWPSENRTFWPIPPASSPIC